MDFTQYINLSVVALAVFLAVVNERLIEWFVNPIFVKLEWDTFFLTYVALATGAALSVATGANALNPEKIPALVGTILTALFVGGGSNLLHQIVPQPLKLIGTSVLLTSGETDEE
jgi:hypothetical protein